MKSLGYYYGKFVKKVMQGKCIISSRIDKTAKINGGCSIVRSEIGRYSCLGYQCELVNCKIGSFSSIASGSFIGGAEHPIQWASTSAVFQKVPHSGPDKRFAELLLPQSKETVIGNDVWIGHNAIVKSGCKIGDGAVVGAGAVVTKDVPPYAIVGGVPAKVIRMRFPEDIVQRLMEIKWWDYPEEKLEAIGPYMDDCEKLIRYIDENFK